MPGLLAFRFDLNHDAREELSLKVRFWTVEHPDGDEHRHIQTFEVRLTTGQSARQGADGAVIITGHTGKVARSPSTIMAFAGLAPDMFAGDAAALGASRNALFKDNRFDTGVFQNRKNFFAKRNVTVIVIEVPSRLVGQGVVHAWATASLCGHAPEVQVSR
jgi:hypothetical protein